MGRSFVLKGATGKPEGYLIQGQGVVRFKGGAMDNARMTIIRADNRKTVWEGTWTAEENEHPDDGTKIAAAYVTENGVLRLYTDEAAKRAFEMEKRECPTERPAGKTKNQEQEKTIYRAEEKKRQTEERVWPERRWPPPPCMPAARYVSGRWLG